MAATVATVEPREIRAGSTGRWDRTLGDYPASAWTLTYRLLSSAGTHTFDATADGDVFAVTVAAATTAAWPPADYEWVATVTDGTTVATVGTGVLTVLYNPGTATAAVDVRSQAQRNLDALDAVMEGRMTNDVASYTIGGRQLSRMGAEDLLLFHKYWKGKVANERAAARRKAGRRDRRQIGVTF
jgi:hypothetical protein